jgi:hypothetical protein
MAPTQGDCDESAIRRGRSKERESELSTDQYSFSSGARDEGGRALELLAVLVSNPDRELQSIAAEDRTLPTKR